MVIIINSSILAHRKHHHRPHHHHRPRHLCSRDVFFNLHMDESRNKGGNGVCKNNSQCDRLRKCNLKTNLCEGLPIGRRHLIVIFR